MTSIKYDKISENKWGELFKVSLVQNNNFKPIEIILKNVKSIFGKETEHNKFWMLRGDVCGARLTHGGRPRLPPQ